MGPISLALSVIRVQITSWFFVLEIVVASDLILNNEMTNEESKFSHIAYGLRDQWKNIASRWSRVLTSFSMLLHPFREMDLFNPSYHASATSCLSEQGPNAGSMWARSSVQLQLSVNVLLAQGKPMLLGTGVLRQAINSLCDRMKRCRVVEAVEGWLEDKLEASMWMEYVIPCDRICCPRKRLCTQDIL